jgi:tetratricopeptide (TPR) repeat protein
LPSEIITVENPVTRKLIEIQGSIAAKEFTKATAELKELLAANPSDPRIYYNLGRVATLEAEKLTDADAQSQKLLEAKTAYTNVIRTAVPDTDRALLSLTYVALARIYEFDDNKDYAVKLYDKAIELSDVPGGAYSQAIVGKQRLLKNP